jgi:hypothetical protein
MPSFPARLHILLARDAPLGVVLRRGPSNHVCTLLWDRRDDSFRLGQWLKGRIYERRCDLSPDGKYLIYFAMNGRWNSETKGSWTAISRAPYLKALALFPKGDCWNGGGLFTGKDTYWMNHDGEDSVLFDHSRMHRDLKYRSKGAFGGECEGVYVPRLLRDGWTLVERKQVGWTRKTRFEKPLRGGWILRKIAHGEIGSPPGKGCYWDEHEVVHPASGQRISGADWEWAEVDGERLVWAAGGKLFAGTIAEDGSLEERLLHDFNEMTFEAIEAPY